MSRSWGWIAVLTVSSLVVALGFAGDLGAAVRPLAVFWFFLVCPGMAFVRLLNLTGWLPELTLAVALSLALDTVVAEVMAVNGWWSLSAGLLALITLTLIGAALQVGQIVWQQLHVGQT